MKNRIMLFYDLENFKKSLVYKDRKRFYDFGKVQYTIVKLVNNVVKINCDGECLVRAYAYTGEYTESILRKVEKEIKKATDEEEKKKKANFLENVKRYTNAQRDFFKRAAHFNFFELRSYPLKYENSKIFQKGVDVQLAVDLVSNAYKNNFDIAIICSGDIDLLESLTIVKSLGKKVIVMSHPHLTAQEIKKEADFYIDVSKLEDKDLEEFSWIKRE